MNRRAFLAALGSTAVAGCSTALTDDDPGGAAETTGTPSETAPGTTSSSAASTTTSTTTETTTAASPPDEKPTLLQYRGAKEEKADLLLVGKDYEDESVMEEDFTYFMDFDGNNRGLFDIPPFDEHRDKFNIWMVNAGSYIKAWEDPEPGRGLVKDSFDVFENYPWADYYTVLAKHSLGRSAFAYSDRNQCWVGNVHRSRVLDQGAKGFLHEFGHSFAGLKDEYYSDDGPDRSGKPNCADSKAQARDWWGDLANSSEEVGYYQGCAYNDENWRPHEKSIMGNGGLWSYGPVNVRALERELAKYE